MKYTTIDFYQEHLRECNIEQLCDLLVDRESNYIQKNDEINKLVIELIKSEIRTKVAA